MNKMLTTAKIEIGDHRVIHGGAFNSITYKMPLGNKRAGDIVADKGDIVFRPVCGLWGYYRCSGGCTEMSTYDREEPSKSTVEQENLLTGGAG